MKNGKTTDQSLQKGTCDKFDLVSVLWLISNGAIEKNTLISVFLKSSDKKPCFYQNFTLMVNTFSTTESVTTKRYFETDVFYLSYQRFRIAGKRFEWNFDGKFQKK